MVRADPSLASLCAISGQVDTPAAHRGCGNLQGVEAGGHVCTISDMQYFLFCYFNANANANENENGGTQHMERGDLICLIYPTMKPNTQELQRFSRRILTK